MIETIALFIHISVAVASILIAALSMKDTLLKSKENAKAKLHTAWIGTGVTILSGTSLAIIANIPFGKICVSMLVFLAAISISQLYFSLSFSRQTNN